MFSMLDHDEVLTAGTYVFMVDPIFNKQADVDEDYKRISIGVYASRTIDLHRMPRKDGMNAIVSAFRTRAAREDDFDKKKKFDESYDDYGGKCYRVCDLTPT